MEAPPLTNTIPSGTETPPAAAAPSADPAPVADPAPDSPPVEAAAPDAPPVDEAAPAPYSFTFPDTFTPDDGVLNEFSTLAAEAKLAPEAAQKIVDLYVKSLLDSQTSAQATFQTMSDTWRTESLALPDFSTDAKREASLASIARVIDEFGTPETRAILDATGAGNNPAILQTFLNIAKALNEGRPTTSGRPAGQSGPKTPGQTLYPDLKQ